MMELFDTNSDAVIYALAPFVVTILIGCITFFFCRRPDQEDDITRPRNNKNTILNVVPVEIKAAEAPNTPPLSNEPYTTPQSHTSQSVQAPTETPESSLPRNKSFVNLFQAGIRPEPIQPASLQRYGTYKLAGNILVSITTGPIQRFDSYPKGAVVVAANRMLKAGSGVAKAVATAGGTPLENAIAKLPVADGGIQCETGEAKLLGPATFHKLNVRYVIMAVGPNFKKIAEVIQDFPEAGATQNRKADRLLAEAYRSALDLAEQAELYQVCFTLLCGGSFKGDRSLSSIVELSILAMKEWAIGIRTHYEANGNPAGNHLIDIVWDAKLVDEATIMMKAASKLLKPTIKAMVNA